MLDITFLNKPKNFHVEVGGLEFMDYQKGDLFQDLVTYLNTDLIERDGQWVLQEHDRAAEALEAIFMKHTGICLKLSKDPVPNAAVESGWFNPGNVLNIPGIEQWLSAGQSNIGQAFKSLKTDILKGWVDTSTGKVGGDYSKVEFNLHLNTYINEFLDRKILTRYKATMQEGLAAFLIHECGHVFAGFLHVHRAVIDPILSTTAVKIIADGKLYGKQRVDVVKEAFKLLECPQQVKEQDIINLSADQLLVYFNKAIATRDLRRTLSLGVQSRSSEIYADLYSIRMGCGKSLVVALSSLPRDTGTLGFNMVAALSVTMIAIAFCYVPVIILGGLAAALQTIIFFSDMLLPDYTYDSRYRRLKTILRDYVVQLNDNTAMDKRTKIKLLADAKEMEKIIEESKPMLESTAIQRFFGWLLNGSDWKAQDFENYTDDLLAHTLSLYKNTF